MDRKTILIVLLAVIATAAITRSMMQREPDPKPTVVTRSKPEIRKQWIQETKQLFTGPVTVSVGRYLTLNFAIPSDVRNARIAGNFRAQGGMRSDIRVFVFAASEVENWANGNTYRRFYDSERVTNGNLNVELAPGNYALVISNDKAWLTDRQVSGDIQVHYEVLK